MYSVALESLIGCVGPVDAVGLICRVQPIGFIGPVSGTDCVSMLTSRRIHTRQSVVQLNLITLSYANILPNLNSTKHKL